MLFRLLPMGLSQTTKLRGKLYGRTLRKSWTKQSKSCYSVWSYTVGPTLKKASFIARINKGELELQACPAFHSARPS